MRAIVYTEYGPPDVLQFTEVAKPTPKDNEVLIKVRAASVNPLDWRLMRGKPLFARLLIGGLRKPMVTRPGVDVAGQVEAVGRNVTQFKPGDEVFGACHGAFAEYVCVIEDNWHLSLITLEKTSRKVGSVTTLLLLRTHIIRFSITGVRSVRREFMSWLEVVGLKFSKLCYWDHYFH